MKMEAPQNRLFVFITVIHFYHRLTILEHEGNGDISRNCSEKIESHKVQPLNGEFEKNL